MSPDIPTAVVLAAHGVPATDYPPRRVGLLMALEFGGPLVERFGFLRARRAALDREVRAWPRTRENDPYKAAVEDLAARLSARLGWPVLAGYNEFCNPTIGEAIDRAVTGGARRVVVVPTMLVRGNKHAEAEILEIVEQARKRHAARGVEFRYAWPFDAEQLVALLEAQVRQCVDG